MDEVEIFDVDTKHEDIWDKEWCRYFSRYQGDVYFTKADEITNKSKDMIADLTGASADKVYNYRSFVHPYPLQVYAAGDSLIGRRVLEIGCGAGNVGKQIGHIAAEYIGVDYSPLALRVAELLSPPTCKYIRITDKGALKSRIGTVDTLISRHFYIHQNWESAAKLLKMSKLLLKRDGIMVADFFLNSKNARYLRSQDDPDPLNPSQMYEYSDDDIGRIAEFTGLRIINSVSDSENQRTFVTLSPSV